MAKTFPQARLSDLSERKLRQLVIDQAMGLEAYFRDWPYEIIPSVNIGLIRAVRALRKKERVNARNGK